MKLYHQQIGLPPVQLPKGEFKLSFTRHAIEAAKSDRYGYIHLPQVLDTANASAMEVGIEDGKLVKVVYRQSYDSKHDICLVIDPRTWRVITVWINRKYDTHRTLDVRKYATV